jgi:hypothetical protein
MDVGASARRVFLGTLACGVVAAQVSAATLPPGFKETKIPGGTMTNVTSMSIAPDGRIFVSEQGTGTPVTGRIRLIKNDVLQATPVLSLPVDATNERGMLGTAFDPDFANNQYFYVYYTVPNPTPDPNLPNLGAHNRISRFTLSGDVALPGSEVILRELPTLGTAPIHNSGAMHFGPDGKLYVSVGENFRAANSQDLTNPLGKLLRLNSDGTVPADNPFVGVPGAETAIWAYGLRNPYTFAIQQGTGRILVNDVGDKLYDEINLIKKGGNYGWGDTEGPHDDPRYEQPFYYKAWTAADCTVPREVRGQVLLLRLLRGLHQRPRSRHGRAPRAVRAERRPAVAGRPRRFQHGCLVLPEPRRGREHGRGLQDRGLGRQPVHLGAARQPDRDDRRAGQLHLLRQRLRAPLLLVVPQRRPRAGPDRDA